jgi:hypothetical protein
MLSYLGENGLLGLQWGETIFKVKIVKFFNSVVLEICMEAVKVGCNDNFS